MHGVHYISPQFDKNIASPVGSWSNFLLQFRGTNVLPPFLPSARSRFSFKNTADKAIKKAMYVTTTTTMMMLLLAYFIFSFPVLLPFSSIRSLVH